MPFLKEATIDSASNDGNKTTAKEAENGDYKGSHGPEWPAETSTSQ